MKPNLLRNATITSLLLTTLVRAGMAQDEFETIASYIEEQTIAIVSVDLTRVDVAQTLKAVSAHVPPGRIRNQLAQHATNVAKPARILRDAEARMYLVFNLADLPAPGPFMITRVKSKEHQTATLKILASTKPASRGLDDNTIFSGSAATLQRIQENEPAVRPRFAHAFAAAGDAPIRIAIAASADQRRVLAEILPQLPDQLGGGSGTAIANIEWLAAGINPPPQLGLDLTVQSTSSDAARSLKSTLTSLIVSLSRLEAVREILPKVDDLASVVLPNVEGRQLRLRINEEEGNLRPLLAAISAPVGQAQEAASRQMCTNNIKQLALAMHNYHDVHRHFPAAASQDEDGNKLLSWRVHVLPYLEQQPLYEKFHLDEPWDSEHNKELISQMPKTFACPSAEVGDGKTTYLVPSGKHTMFDGATGLRIRDVRDGTSNTIFIVDAAPERAVIWTKPDDFTIDPDNPLEGLVGQHGKSFATGFCDGSVRHIPSDVAVQTLKWLFDPSDGNSIPRF